MAKIAITGAGGHIGSKLAENLAKDNEVVRIDVKGTEKIVDVRDLKALTDAIAGCDTLIHLARAGGGVKAPWSETLPNIDGSYNAYEAARLAGLKRVIMASSNHAVGMYEVQGAPDIYKPKNGTLLRVDVPFRADGLYGVWKAFNEVLGRFYSDEHGLQVACLRIGTTRDDGAKTADDLAKKAAESARAKGADIWGKISEDDARARMSSIYVSHRDIAGLCRAVIGSDVPFGVVYAVSDNASRFWDLEEGRRLYGWWPVDGIK